MNELERRLAENLRLQHLFVLIFFSVLAALMFWRYAEASYLVGTDAMGFPAELKMMQVDDSYFSTWRALTSLGHLQYPSPTLGLSYMVGMGVLGLDPMTICKMTIVLSFILSGVLMYFCARFIVGGFLASFAAAVIYSFNQVFLSQITEVHYGLMMGYALFPLLFTVYYAAVMRKGRGGTIALPVVSILFATVAAAPMVVIAIVFLALFTLFHLLFLPKKDPWRIGGTAAICVLCILILLIPYLLMMSWGGGSGLLNVSYSVEDARNSSSPAIPLAFILASSENTFVDSSATGEWTALGFLWPIGFALMVIVPFYALLSLRVRSKRHLVLPLLIPALLFVLVAAFPNTPPYQLFEWVFDNVPYADTMRAFSRFLLLTGFCYALLVAILVSNLDEVKRLTRFPEDWRGKVKRFFFGERKRMVAIIVVAMLFPSSIVFNGELRSYNFPQSYSQPLDWLAEEQGDFRVLYLPLGHLYYTIGDVRLDGYPPTVSIDPGIISPLVTEKAFAWGLETEDFWAFVSDTLSNREFGSDHISELLGNAASVKYVVDQAYDFKNETGIWKSLEQIVTLEEFSGGAVLYQDLAYEQRAHTLEGVVLTSGGRYVMPLAMGLGVIDPTSQGMILISQVDEGALEDVLSSSNALLLGGGDLVELMVESSQWTNDQLVDLAAYGNDHEDNPQVSWIVSTSDYYAGWTTAPGIETTGTHSVNVPIDLAIDGYYDLLIRYVQCPDGGNLSLAVDGADLSHLSLASQAIGARWLRIENIQLDAGKHTVNLGSDGSGRVSLQQLVVLPHSEVEQRLADTSAFLQANQDRLVEALSSAHDIDWEQGTAFLWQGDQGLGMSTAFFRNATQMPSDVIPIADTGAVGGSALWSNDTNESVVDNLRLSGFRSGSNVTLTLNLKVDDNTIADQICSAKVMAAGMEIATLNLTGTNFTSASAYQRFELQFTVPDGWSAEELALDLETTMNNTGLWLDYVQAKVIPNDRSTFTLDVLFDGNYTITIDRGASPFNGTYEDGYLLCDGVPLVVTGPNDTEQVAYTLPNITAGPHIIEVGYDYTYGFKLEPSAHLNTSSSSSSVTYHRNSPTSYTVSIDASSPCWLLLSESYHPLWTATMDGVQLDHVRMDSVVNGFYVPTAGNHTILIEFGGEELYGEMVLIFVVITLVPTATIAAIVVIRSRRRRT